MLKIKKIILLQLLLGVCQLSAWNINQQLYHAIKDGATEKVQELLHDKVDVNYKDKHGQTALMMAACEGHREIVQMLLNAQADPNAKNGAGQTALMIAAVCGHTEIVQVLLNAHADINATTNCGFTAVLTAADYGQTEMVKVLLQAKADPNIAGGKYGTTALMCATRLQSSAMVQALVDAHANLNAQDDDGRTALMVAIRNDVIKVIEILLNGNADTNVQDADGDTALMEAIKGGGPWSRSKNYFKIVQMLLAHNADPNIADKKGRTALIHAVKFGRGKRIQALLDAHADPNIQDIHGKTALIYAVENDIWPNKPSAETMERVKILLKHGADPSIADKTGKTAIMQAANMGFTQIEQLLRNAILNRQETISQKDLASGDKQQATVVQPVSDMKSSGLRQRRTASSSSSAQPKKIEPSLIVSQNDASCSSSSSSSSSSSASIQSELLKSLTFTTSDRMSVELGEPAVSQDILKKLRAESAQINNKFTQYDWDIIIELCNLHNLGQAQPDLEADLVDPNNHIFNTPGLGTIHAQAILDLANKIFDNKLVIVILLNSYAVVSNGSVSKKVLDSLTPEKRKILDKYCYLHFGKHLKLPEEQTATVSLAEHLEFKPEALDAKFRALDATQTRMSLNLNKHSLSDLAGWDSLFENTIKPCVIVIIDLSHNNLTALDPKLLEGFSNLEELSLSHNELTGLPNGLFKDCAALKKLSLDHNKLTQIAAELLQSCTQLQLLTYDQNCSVDASILSIIEQNLGTQPNNSSKSSSISRGFGDRVASFVILGVIAGGTVIVAAPAAPVVATVGVPILVTKAVCWAVGGIFGLGAISSAYETGPC